MAFDATSVPGPPADLAREIRVRGPVLDMELTQRLYGPLLAQQNRDGVELRRDLSYADDERHRLDVYRPSAPASVLRPVLVFFHGGGFIRGDKSHRDNVGYYFARRGFVVIIPNYRLGPTHQWPSGAEDVIRSYLWTASHCSEFSGDREQIFVGGESAGAAHVAAATLIRRFHPPSGLHVRGLLLVSGVYNVHLEKLARRQLGIDTPDPRNEAYFGTEFSRYPAMSTATLVDAAPLPLFMSYAELDLLQMQVQAGELFARLVCDHQFMPELQVVPSHNHLTQVFAINTGDESLSALLLDFMRRHTAPSLLPSAGDRMR